MADPNLFYYCFVYAKTHPGEKTPTWWIEIVFSDHPKPVFIVGICPVTLKPFNLSLLTCITHLPPVEIHEERCNYGEGCLNQSCKFYREKKETSEVERLTRAVAETLNRYDFTRVLIDCGLIEEASEEACLTKEYLL